MVCQRWLSLLLGIVTSSNHSNVQSLSRPNFNKAPVKPLRSALPSTLKNILSNIDIILLCPSILINAIPSEDISSSMRAPSMSAAHNRTSLFKLQLDQCRCVDAKHTHRISSKC